MRRRVSVARSVLLGIALSLATSAVALADAGHGPFPKWAGHMKMPEGTSITSCSATENNGRSLDVRGPFEQNPR